MWSAWCFGLYAAVFGETFRPPQASGIGVCARRDGVVPGERLLGRVDAVGIHEGSLADGYFAFPVGQSPETPGG